MHSSSDRMERRGFSLIEIILAIAVIAILAVLILPALGRARENARAGACIQKLRNIGAALGTYMAEHNGALIPYASLGGNPAKYWFDELDRYMGIQEDDEQLRVRTHPHKWQICPSKPVVPESRQAVGYGWNHRYLGYQPNDKRGGPANIRQIVRPSETVVIGDSQDIPDPLSPPAVSQHRYLYSNSAGSLARRHSGRGFYLMLDGHVMPATPEEIVDAGSGPYRLFWRKPR